MTALLDDGHFFLPGPTEVRPEILAAMLRPMIPHRGKVMEQLFANIQAGLKPVFRTDRQVLVSSSSATGLMEAGVRCAPAGPVLSMVNGAFSERFAQVARACGRTVEVLEVPLGETVPLEQVEAQLRAKSFAAVTVAHSETSTGALTDVRAVQELARRHGAMCLVDSVTGVAGTPLECDGWEMDYVFTGSQKALALPPGLAFGVASDAFLAQARSTTGRGLYFDLVEFEAFGRKDQTPNTPALSLLYALEAQVAAIALEGVEARWARHGAMAARVREWAATSRRLRGPRTRRRPGRHRHRRDRPGGVVGEDDRRRGRARGVRHRGGVREAEGEDLPHRAYGRPYPPRAGRVPGRDRPGARCAMTYWPLSRSARYSILFALPLLLAYEGLAFALGGSATAGVRNGADVLLKSLFLTLGGQRGLLLFNVVLLAVGATLVWRDRATGGPLRPWIFALMLAESTGLALLFGTVVGVLTALVLQGPAALAVGGLSEFGFATQVMLSLGAGIYEELLFRVILVSGLAFLARRVIGWLPGASNVAAVLLGAMIFSAFHYIGPYGDPWELQSFTFRFVAGLVLNGLYVVRGFGIAAWTHALYDVILSIVGNRRLRVERCATA